MTGAAACRRGLALLDCESVAGFQCATFCNACLGPAFIPLTMPTFSISNQLLTKREHLDLLTRRAVVKLAGCELGQSASAGVCQARLATKLHVLHTSSLRTARCAVIKLETIAPACRHLRRQHSTSHVHTTHHTHESASAIRKVPPHFKRISLF